ncbi:MAG: hypothetical protein IJ025_02040 [Clostridia bacterium]|nr:hypothetical protein [Clostridia bacterium]
MVYYLGIDGGGTRTTAAVSDGNGTLILKAVGNTVNFYSVGMEKARENLAEIMTQIHEKIGDVTFKGTFIGCSALDNCAGDELTHTLCDGVINSEKITMNSDTYVALFSGDCSVSRAVVICGTGSMVTGVDENNRIYTKGGWGHIIGDGGSGYSIAVNGLSEAVNLFDENRLCAPLVKSACEFFGTDDLREIIETVYSQNTTKDIVADFAKFVSRDALAGDTDAMAILKKECKKLARTVFSLLDDMNNCEIVYLYGGVFQNNETFKECFVVLLNEKYPHLKAELLKMPPDEGALKLAMNL